MVMYFRGFDVLAGRGCFAWRGLSGSCFGVGAGEAIFLGSGPDGALWHQLWGPYGVQHGV